MIAFHGLRVGGGAPATLAPPEASPRRVSGHPPSAAAATVRPITPEGGKVPLLRRTGRQAAPTPSGGREKRPFGRPCGPLRSSSRGPCDGPASRRTTLLAEKPARPSDVSPSYESKYSARAAWRCLRIGKGAQRRHGAKEPGHRSRQNGPSGASRRSPDEPHRASRRSYPRDRFAAIKSLPSGRIML